MTAILPILDGYVMVLMIYLVCNGLLLFAMGDTLRIRWWALLPMTILEAIIVYQILHYLWLGNVIIILVFSLLLLCFSTLAAYKLLYLVMATVACTTVLNLMFYMVWGPSYTWCWDELVWMLLAYALCTPLVGLGMRRLMWPWLSQLDLLTSRWLWIIPVFAITLIMLVGSAHLQFLMMGYEAVYGLTAMVVVVLSTGISLLVLAIVHKTQLASSHTHDMELVKMQIAAQSNRYGEVIRQMDEVRIMRHDLRHHVRMINSLVGKGDMEGLRAFAGEMACDSRLYDNIIYSQNPISDLVAHHAAITAREADIRLSIRCGLPRSFWMLETDLCMLLGNLLDNALNACQLQTEGEREIILSCMVQDAQALITVENTCCEAAQDTPAWRKKAGIPRGSGYGLLSVRSIADKYNGMAAFDRDAGRYRSTVLLFRPPDVEYSLRSPANRTG